MVYPTDMGIKWDQSIHSMDLGFPDGQECPFSCLWTAMGHQSTFSNILRDTGFGMATEVATTAWDRFFLQNVSLNELYIDDPNFLFRMIDPKRYD